jgi:hypothetical protein
MKAKVLPPFEALQELLHYDPDTGTLTWKQSRGRVRKGQAAGNVGSNAYWCLRFGGTNWLAHRIIWKLQTGADPEPGLVIDHLNGNRADNRWSNLRVTSQSVNVGRAAFLTKAAGRTLPRNVTLDKRRGTYCVTIGRLPARRTRSGLSLEQATALAREWSEELYPGRLGPLHPC